MNEITHYANIGYINARVAAVTRITVLCVKIVSNYTDGRIGPIGKVVVIDNCDEPLRCEDSAGQGFVFPDLS